jgi:hypothetical protein
MNWIGLQIGIRKARKRVNRSWFTNECDYDRQMKTARKTGKPCSCYLCGNRRKYAGATNHERKWNERAKEWI